MIENPSARRAVEHRGVVIAPLFPRRTPRGGVRDARGRAPARPPGRRGERAGSVPELAVKNPTDANVLLYDGEELLGAKQNRILNVTVLVAARSTTRSRSRASRRAAGAAARRASRPRRTRRIPGAAAPEGAAARGRAARARRRPGRRLGRGAGEVRAHGRPLADRRAGGRLPVARGASCASSSRRSRSCPASAARCSRSATTSASTTSRGRRRSRASTRSCARATCSTRSSGSTAAGKDAVRRSSPRSAPATRPAGARPASARTCGSSGEGVVGSGLELDGELLQLCAFTSGDERSTAGALRARADAHKVARWTSGIRMPRSCSVRSSRSSAGRVRRRTRCSRRS